MHGMTALEWIGFVLLTAMAWAGAGHALLRKSDPRSALGWVGICLTFPLAGPTLYVLFGINRVRRRAARMRRALDTLSASCPSPESEFLGSAIGYDLLHPSFRPLERVGRNVLGTDLLGGNCIVPLHNGDEAYPHMLRAIDQAAQSIYLATYIFDTDATGRQFIAALRAAVERGVEVRVLVDGMGEKYSWPRVTSLLREAGVPAALFIPPRLFPPALHINLRNHRKVLIVDGGTAFTGGMNVSRGNVLGTRPPRPVTDLHFKLFGPVVGQLQEAFVDDWFFATQERLNPPVTTQEPAGDSLCRVVVDGPDCVSEPLVTLLAGIISAASSSIRIMTPYFLPPRSLLLALKSASYRGVDVQIILPERNNIPFVQWAARHILPDLLRAGVTVAYQPPPFCHTKLMLVDNGYAHLGSANFDSRSLRLNFELTLEVLELNLAETLRRHFDTVMQGSRLVTRYELEQRSLGVRLRDAFFWLFTPYL